MYCNSDTCIKSMDRQRASHVLDCAVSFSSHVRKGVSCV